MEKIVIIGMGFIGGYLTPGYHALLGETLRGQVYGIKATDRDLEARRRAFPFEIQVGGTAELLEQVRPTILILSPPPAVVPDITREILAPHYARCRERGEPLPDLYTFAPDPSADWFTDQLGEDVNVAKILPNIVDYVGTVNMAPLGTNFISVDARRSWPVERMEKLETLLSPYGENVVLTDGDSMLLLAAKITSHVFYEISYTIVDRMNAGGIPVSLGQLGSGIRAAHRARYACPPPELLPCSLEDVPPVLRHFLQRLVTVWYDGMMDYTYQQPCTVGANQAEHINNLSFELNVMPIQVESREKLEQNTKNAGTKGGVLEKGVHFFQRYMEAPLAAAVDALLAGTLEEDFYDFAQGMGYTITLAAHRHSYRLSRRK